ncbi:MAG: 30S ribosomal protein S17 [Patescibacteria group bacterium]|nr:30S ribosomal protein S17 [Patescibacteria group bacterium]
MEATTPKSYQTMVGEIVSHKTPKTATVKVTSVKVHPKYHKRYNSVKKYVVHDEDDGFKVGDKVEFVPSRPYSATKKFKIVKKA